MRAPVRRAAAMIAALAAVLLTGPGQAPAQAAVTPTPSASVTPDGSDTPATTAPRGPIVLIGTGGVRWNDVSSSTPAFYGFLDQGSSGWLAVRSVRPTTCPADGWLAVSAGRRAADTLTGPDAKQTSPACRDLTVTVPTPGAAATVPRWSEYVSAAKNGSFDATPGLLGDALAADGKTAVAVGPGAAIALARSSGTAGHVYATTDDDSAAATTADPELLADDVKAAIAQNPGVLVVDIGDVRDPAQRLDDEPAGTGLHAQSRADQVTALDNRLNLVVNALPRTSTVILASLADSGSRSQLQLLGAQGRSVEQGGDDYVSSLIGSESTRQNGMAQTTDLLPSLLIGNDVAVPQDAVGSPLRAVAEGGSTIDRLEHLDDLDRAARAVNPIVPWFFKGLVVAQILLYGLITVVLRRRSRYTNTHEAVPSPAAAHLRARTLTWMRIVTVIFACFPAATFLANLLPWWRAGMPGLAVTLDVIAFVVPLALFALLGPWRKTFLGQMGAVGGATAAVLAGDVLTGSHLMISSLMGVQPVIAGRFYGFGNPAFALFATGTLLLAIAVADWLVTKGAIRTASWSVAGIALVATVIDGTPGLGSDFGGPPAIIPAFAVLALLVAGIRINLRRALLIAGLTIGVIVLLSVLDWLRPAQDRTHLGRFVQTVLDGGAWDVIERKGQQNLRILFTSWLSALLPFAVAFVVLVLSRPVAWGARPLQLAYTRSPVLKQGVIAFGVMILLGFALNDSGTAVPAVAATVAIPLLISVSARALQLHDSEELAAAIEAARRSKRVRR